MFHPIVPGDHSKKGQTTPCGRYATILGRSFVTTQASCENVGEMYQLFEEAMSAFPAHPRDSFTISLVLRGNATEIRHEIDSLSPAKTIGSGYLASDRFLSGTIALDRKGPRRRTHGPHSI
jgi:hypothetical protein